MDRTAEKFVAYASDLTYADITPQAIHAAKRSLIDAIGCAYGAFDAEPVKSVRGMAEEIAARSRPATIIGTRNQSSPELAAFANAAAIRYLDFSDDCFGPQGDSGPHPSDNIGAVLAAAESSGVDGKTFLLGMVLAYEACGQLVQHAVLRVHGWDYPIYHAVASALGTSKVLCLSRTQIHDALALAIVPNICLSQTREGLLTNWKGLAGPNGSRNGFFAAMLANAGINGPHEPFEGKGGFMKQLDNTFELSALGGAGVPFQIEKTFFKSMAVKYGSQLPIWVALELRNKVALDDIAALCIYIIKRQAASRLADAAYWDPQSRETADHSTPYLVAAALVDGEISERTFTPECYRDPVVLALLQKISMEAEPEYARDFPRTFQCRIEATLKSGDLVTVYQVNPKGHPANPMTDRDIEDKFLRHATPLLPVNRARALLAQLWQVEKLDHIAEIFPLMVI